MKTLILASASKSRKELLEKLGVPFCVVASEYEEYMDPKMPAEKLAAHLSYEKARAVAALHPRAIIIAADTFILFQNEFLGKPHTRKKAVQMLTRLQGKQHSIITGFTVLDASSGKRISKTVEAKVTMKKLTQKEIARYVASNEPFDKAGAYAIQGLGSVLVRKVEGDFYGAVGLPLGEVADALHAFGIKVL